MNRVSSSDYYQRKTISVANRSQNHIGEENRRKAIDYSMMFNFNRRFQEISCANSKLLGRLMEISNRKKTTAVFQTHKPKNISRLLKLKNIEVENIKIGERIMKKQSEYDRSRVTKDVRSYEKLKKMLTNNRKVKNSHLQGKVSSVNSPYFLGCREDLRNIRTEHIQSHLFKNEFMKGLNTSQNASKQSHLAPRMRAMNGLGVQKLKTEGNELMQRQCEQI